MASGAHDAPDSPEVALAHAVRPIENAFASWHPTAVYRARRPVSECAVLSDGPLVGSAGAEISDHTLAVAGVHSNPCKCGADCGCHRERRVFALEPAAGCLDEPADRRHIRKLPDPSDAAVRTLGVVAFGTICRDLCNERVLKCRDRKHPRHVGSSIGTSASVAVSR